MHGILLSMLMNRYPKDTRRRAVALALSVGYPSFRLFQMDIELPHPFVPFLDVDEIERPKRVTVPSSVGGLGEHAYFWVAGQAGDFVFPDP